MRRTAIAATLLLSFACGLPALAQDGDNPPVIVDISWQIARWNEGDFRASGYAFDLIFGLYTLFPFWDDPVPFDPYTEIARELDVILVQMLVIDDDLEDGDQSDVEFFYRVRAISVSSGPPVPPPMFGAMSNYATQGGGFPVDPPPDNAVLLFFELGVPMIQGANQLRLRGRIDWDVAWSIDVRVSNDEDPDPITGVWDEILFPVYAVESPILAPPNPPPFADAGGDLTVQAGDTATLDGSLSFDSTNLGFDPLDPNVIEKDVLEYNWEWQSGPERVDPAPDPDEPAGSPLAVVTLEVPGTYVYRLLVEDGVNTPPSTDEVTIYVLETLAENRAPTAVITGPTASVNVGSAVELSAEDSSDPDGDTLTYRWRQTNEIGGPLAADEVELQFQPLSGVTSETASWRATGAGTYYFGLLVTDPSGLSDTDTITVVVADSGGTNMSGRASGAGDGTGQWGAGGGAPGAPACGAGALPVAAVPVVLLLLRGRLR